MTEYFDRSWLGKLWKPTDKDNKFGAGQVTIVGGSSLFHGAPVLALRVASRLVSMVYFVSPEKDKGVVNNLKSALGSFIWVPFEEANRYAEKSDAILIGPGMMRNQKEADGMVCDETGKKSQEITLSILTQFPKQRLVIDGGSLQVIHIEDIPRGSVITPNRREFMMLFGEEVAADEEKADRQIMEKAKKYGIVIVHKAARSIVTDGERLVVISGGNSGLVKGGVGDVMAGLTVGLLAKNEPVLAAATAVYLSKRAAERLFERVGYMFNADDLADEVGRVYREETPHPRQ